MNDVNIFNIILLIFTTFWQIILNFFFSLDLNEWFSYFQDDNHRWQLIRNFLKIPYFLKETELFKHVLRKRNVYDTITGSRDLTSSHAANDIHQTIQRLRQLQRLENKHRRFLHGAPVSIGLALPVLSRNINVPSTSTKR